MEQNRPRGRERGETVKAGEIKIHGEGLGTGPVGSSSGHAGRTGNTEGSGIDRGIKTGQGAASGNGQGTGTRPGNSGSGLGSGKRPGQGAGTRPGGSGSSFGGSSGSRKPGGISPLILLVITAVVLIGGGSGIGALFGGGSAHQSNSLTYGTGHSAYEYGGSGTSGELAAGTIAGGQTGSSQNTGENAGHSANYVSAGSLQSYINSFFGGDPSTYSTSGNVGEVTAETAGEPVSEAGAETAQIDSSTPAGVRQKRTEIVGGGRDTVTIMVYMCGTDLESRSGMATSDLQEMASANLGDINLLVYTGGCARWKNSVISSDVNQIFQIRNGRMTCLVENAGTTSLTDPATLASFIKWCDSNFPANRNELIFWDHGGGSVSGFGYDEKNRSAGSMSLSGINKALSAGGVTFDFIGFDACLMATAENALMLNNYGDYMIASEETEPGVGWYYTDWLTNFGANTSLPTTELGKQIADDFVKVCERRCPGQQTTLSVIDLAEFAHTVPVKLGAFAQSISGMISDRNFRQVSSARNRTREFASSTRIDQIDLVDLCENLGNAEGLALAKALRGAIKYNTCRNISRAAGVSIYFPYQSTSKVDAAVNTYAEIGMDANYARCIREFASLEVAGQAASGGSGSLLGSLLGGSYSQGPVNYGADALSGFLDAFFNGNLGTVSGRANTESGFLSERSLSNEQMAAYISENHIDAEQLVFEEQGDGSYRMTLPEETWKQIEGLDLNLFYDNGNGFIDLGLDNIYSFDDKGRLVANTDKVWLALNNTIVPYYHESTEDDGENYLITGRIPCLLNGTRSELIVVFDNLHPDGMLAGARTVYADGETETVGKSLTSIENGDIIQVIADFYGYDGSYSDTFLLGDPITVTDNLTVRNADFSEQGAMQVTYRFRDIYNNQYWSQVINVE